MWGCGSAATEHCLGGAGNRGRGDAKGARCPQHLLVHLVVCHSFLGWFSWLGVVAEWQSRSSVPAVPSPALGRAWLSCWVGLGAQSWGGAQRPHWQHLLFTPPKGVRQHLSFSLDSLACFRAVPLARKKIYFCFKNKNKKKKKGR